jgi:hypothetical protein
VCCRSSREFLAISSDALREKRENRIALTPAMVATVRIR